MIILLITENKIIKTMLPKNIYGNYWITETVNNVEQKFLNVEEENKKWKVKSNSEYQLIDSNKQLIESIYMEDYKLCYVKVAKTNELFLLYSMPIFDKTIIYLNMSNKKQITIGSSATSDIVYNNKLVTSNHSKLTFENDKWKIKDLNSNLGVFVNNNRVREQFVEYGDVIFILGLKIILLKDKIIINNPNNMVTYNDFTSINVSKLKNDSKNIIQEEKEEIEMYNNDDYFLRAPRFKTSIEKETMVIDPPPTKVNQQEMPLIFMLGSMLSVGTMSMMSLYTTLDSVVAGTRTLESSWPSLVGGGVMLMSMILWPILNRKYQKKLKIKNEKERQEKYRKYIEEKEKNVDMIMRSQTQILKENYIPCNECENIILTKNRQLWERKIEQNDFLSVRLGLGDVPVELDIRYPEEHFTMEEDDLKEILKTLVDKTKELENVPIVVSLVEKYILAIVGKYDEITSFMKKIILQLLTFHSYEDLKLVFFLNSENEKDWEYVKVLPHTWSNDKKVRYFATNYNEMQQISDILEKEFKLRNEQKDSTYKNFLPYYVIIIDDYATARGIEIVIDGLKQKYNIGFNIIVLNENLSTLPNECTTFINVSNMKGGLFESELISTKQKEFNVDEYNEENFKACCLSLINTPIKFSNDMYSLPNTYTFLEMYNVGKVEQLNSLSRWKMNDTTLTLQAPVGIDTHGMLFNLDIHEKAHGPHGLIAGMTGSGKSEFLISYILSLAVNYHPDDLSFILIDYKGGGLAGAFENDNTGVKLPHLAGKITNLDTAEMKRALVSIQSELRRRQKIFDETRKKLNEGVVDIYKYQKLYHSGLVSEPVSHLLIISDEFAELKMQQPDFMDQLISTARIGRSLGVHLILATQKPSGIVNDQIRSNSRFKICLKVQETSDSTDVIGVPDAASLKNPGRFYLQVGYKEYFAIGQSAWSGTPYIPSDKLQKKIDKSIDFVNNIGMSIKEVEEMTKGNTIAMGEQVTNIVKYLSDIAKISGIKIKQLWLNKIPAIISLLGLKEKYDYQVTDDVTAIIGEYDDPFNQRKDLLTLNLTTEGNVVVHGVTGSGKEMLLSTIIYSLITTYTPSDVNIYILDLGTNLLQMYRGIPHVGDIIDGEDEDKLINLFKFLNATIEKRKDIFKDYGGSYESYLKASKEKMPIIVMILNNYEAFSENFSDLLDDDLIRLTREGLKYGIVFILTTTSTNLRYKLSQNFAQRLVLQLNDDSDYSSIVGNTNKLYPSNFKGRGLIRLDNVYEFQTATIVPDEEIIEFIKEERDKLNDKFKNSAQSIPALPSSVTLKDVIEKLNGLKNIPIGIEKEGLGTSIYDFESDLINIISSQEIVESKSFIQSLINEFEMLNNINLFVIDTKKMFNDDDFKKCSYYNDNFNTIFNQMLNLIKKYNENQNMKLNNTLFIIIGVDKFITNVDNKNNGFKLLFDEAKNNDKFNFVLIDDDITLKKYTYDEWYRDNIGTSQGIWLGNGLTEQYVIKITKMEKKFYQEIGNNFGYVIEKGNPILVKLINCTNIEGEKDE